MRLNQLLLIDEKLRILLQKITKDMNLLMITFLQELSHDSKIEILSQQVMNMMNFEQLQKILK